MAGARRRMRAAKARAEAGRREKERDESGFEQHAVGLVAGEILRGADKGKEANEADGQSEARPDIETMSTEAMRPSQQTNIKAWSVEEIQNSEGTYQKREP